MARLLNVLIVDDNRKDRILLINKLSEIGDYEFNFTQAPTIKAANEHLSGNDYNLVFLDFLLDDGDGFSLLGDLSNKKKRVNPIIFTTAYGNGIVKEDSISIGARAYIDKSDVSRDDLQATIKQIVN